MIDEIILFPSPGIWFLLPPKNSWCRPTPRWIKLNVNGAWLEICNASGIGGLFRDALGHTFFSFSLPVGSCSAPSIEFLAIKQGIYLFKDSKWFSKYNLVIESDSAATISWVKNPSKAPYCLMNLVLVTGL
ncbi:hypothetical protein F3Y22_tig00111445pilonHSYRG00097 [Hibiscus syriacus]|uniref:RNase H type-1 domain-containing protein n=1 Tax=Hibiscus syriacus TaxID=106335 RepID=A0A6A2XR83_HIBSY|nr:hypothetical protein F3Y22_tig00111445pilonHSYRG00097 [Hibiscus syriacus]